MRKPLIGVLKKTGKKVAEKGVEKPSNVVVKKVGDKIGNILRKRSSRRRPTKTTASKPKVNQSNHDAMVRLNQLI